MPEAIGGDDLEERTMGDLRERTAQWIADEEERGAQPRSTTELVVEGFALIASAAAVVGLELPRATDAIFERLDAIAGRLA